MIHRIFTVYDAAAGAYLQPFYSKTKALAIRSFQEAANDPKHQFSQYPADYTLFEIGEFDDNSGLFKSLEQRVNLGSALEHKTQAQEA